MSRLAAAIDALTQGAHPAATLAAFTLSTRREYPGGIAAALGRAEQKQLRRLERAARLALKQPLTEIYSVLPGPAWHVILAPHATPERIYLARADHQRHYARTEILVAPIEPPATLLAHWTDDDEPHRFAHVATDAQLSLLMYYSTAQEHVYLAPRTPLVGSASRYTAARPE